jgi:transposase, IS6 family
LPLTTAFLGLAVGALAFRARLRRNYGPFLFGLAASVVVLAGKFAFGSNAATYGGLAALIAAAVWNAWSPRGRLAGSSSVCSLFKWRQFEPEVILLAVGWYLRFSLSYRDVEELLAERACTPITSRYGGGATLRPGNGTTLALEAQNRAPTAGGWTLTYIRVNGKWRYLYRAVDSSGASSWSQAGRGRGQALSCQSARQSKPSDAASHQHRLSQSVPARDRATQSRRRPLRGIAGIDRCRT